MGKKRKTLNEWVENIHNLAKSKGWWDDPRDDLHIMALLHSEVSEAVECFRDADMMSNLNENGIYSGNLYLKEDKPEGPSVELVDTLIRIFDYFGQMEWDLEEVLEVKHRYNETRPYKHGKLK